MMLLMDEVHPDRKDETWPPLFTNPRVFAQETVMHGVFGTTLGLLAGHPEPPTWRKRMARLAILAGLLRRAAQRQAKAKFHDVAERLPEWDAVEKQLREWEARGKSLADWPELEKQLRDSEARGKSLADWPELEKQLRDWEARGKSLADWDEFAERLARWEEAAKRPISTRT